MSGPIRSVIKPGKDRKQDAIDFYKALTGKEPTPEQLAELDQAASGGQGTPPNEPSSEEP
jgi:hypothetical protein